MQYNLDIEKEKDKLIECLKESQLGCSHYINQNAQFFKKITSDHPLQEVIEECKNTIREGFLTPLTQKSSISIEFSPELFVDEIIQNIKTKHQYIQKQEQLIVQLQKNIEIINQLQINYEKQNEELYEIQLLNQTYEDYNLYLNRTYIQPKIWVIQNFRLDELINFSLYYKNQQVELISVNLIDILIEKSMIQSEYFYPEYSTLLYLNFLETEVQPVQFEFQINIKMNITNELKKQIIKHIEMKIKEINNNLIEQINSINRLLEPFSKKGIKYERGIGIIENDSLQKGRNFCCLIF